MKIRSKDAAISVITIIVASLIVSYAWGNWAINKPTKAQQIICQSLNISHVEITQATQNINNSIQLIDGRRTGVRVYATGFPTGCRARAKLYISPESTSGGRKYYGMWSENGILSMKQEYNRENENDSFNFSFVPDGWLGQSYRFRVVVGAVVSGSGIPTDEVLCQTYDQWIKEGVVFAKVCPPLIAGVRAAWVGGDAYGRQPPLPEGVMEGVGDAMMWGVYPFPEYDSGFAHGGGYVLMNPKSSDYLKIYGSPTRERALFDGLRRYLRTGTIYDYIVGWIRTRPSDHLAGGAAIPGERYAWASASDEFFLEWNAVVGAHEVGHMFGMSAHDFGGIELGEVGWDVKLAMQSAHVRSSENGEYMMAGYDPRPTPSPYVTTWTGTEAYEFIMSNENECPRITQQYYIIPINPPEQINDYWRLGYMYEMSGIGRQIASENNGNARIEILNDAGELTYFTNLDVRSCNGDCLDVGNVAIVPSQHMINAMTVTLSVDGISQESRVKSDRSPQLSIVSPQAGWTLESGTIIEWTVTDGDEDLVRSVVDYSHDGYNWRPLLGEIDGQSIVFDPDGLPFSENGHIRVSVSDGINSSTSVVSGLLLNGNHHPNTRINSPSNNSIFAVGANVILSGIARDPEDGDLDPIYIQWTSSIDGVIGKGSLINTTDLSIGNHVITMSAIDIDGGQVDESISISIIPSAVLPAGNCGCPTPTPHSYVNYRISRPMTCPWSSAAYPDTK